MWIAANNAIKAAVVRCKRLSVITLNTYRASTKEWGNLESGPFWVLNGYV